MTNPKLLLFDLGGVLIENGTFERLNRLLPASQSVTALKHRWLRSPAVRAFELGRLSPEDFAKSFVTEWKIRLSPAVFLQEFAAWPTGFYPEARATLNQLRQHYRIGCFSNSNVLHWDKFGGFRQEFDIPISSHLIGTVKPDSMAFTQALKVCGERPSNVYFFDDSIDNINSAWRLGIRSFHVDGFDRLLSVLNSENLLLVN